jgi:hypothetical protein
VVRFKLIECERKVYDKIFETILDRVTKILEPQQLKSTGKLSGKLGGQMVEIFVYLLRLREACCHMSLLSEVEVLGKDVLVETEGIYDSEERNDIEEVNDQTKMLIQDINKSETHELKECLKPCL